MIIQINGRVLIATKICTIISQVKNHQGPDPKARVADQKNLVSQEKNEDGYLPFSFGY